MTPYAKLVIGQFDEALDKVSSAERLAVQREMTDLFLATSYTEGKAAIFNAVMGRLIEKIDRRGLLEMSGRLAAIDYAPALVIVRLSTSDDIAVAGPVLEKSNVLTDEHLVAVAKTKSQDHLAAIAARARINEVVTDVLVQRGNADVAQRLVANMGARFSEIGFVRVIHGASSNEALRAALTLRKDVPEELVPFLQAATV